MFRWCAFCQHLIGEIPPLDDFQVTHGICDACSVDAASLSPAPGVLRARELFSTLEVAGRSGDFLPCDQAIEEALTEGMRPSEIMIGVLHPSLNRIGDLWETGEITVADEHRFTDFSLRLLDRLRSGHQPDGAPLVLLAPFEDNSHEIGMRMIQHLTRERGNYCERLPAGTSRAVLLEAAARRRPAIIGISVALTETIPAAMEFARDISGELPPGTKVILGGQAFRHGDRSVTPGDVIIARTIDDYILHLEATNRDRTASGRPGVSE